MTSGKYQRKAVIKVPKSRKKAYIRLFKGEIPKGAVMK